jgi:alkylation response protein AidB-like acyl-CoA dehydrogenase
MKFAFDEQQLEFRAQLRAFAHKECTSTHVREAWTSALGWEPRRWESLAQMGIVGLTVPEAYGGLGLGLVDVVLLLEEAGRACMPEPLLETTVLGVPLLVAASDPRSEARRADWLPRIGAGESVLTVGLASMTAVPAAQGADLLLLEHCVGNKRELHAVPAEAVDRVPRPALDGTRRPASIAWDPSAETMFASGRNAEHLLSATFDRAACGSAALLTGLADRMITMTAQYALERTQFGKPIGSFQAVKHHLVNALVRLEFARPVVYRAAWSLDNAASDASAHASMAKAEASGAALLAARVALQVHGAIGYTWEHDLHLWMKRAWALAAAWGDARSHRSKVLDSLVAALAGPPGR